VVFVFGPVGQRFHLELEAIEHHANPQIPSSGDRQPISKLPEIGVSPRWPEY
jgi:hypothetical protein